MKHERSNIEKIAGPLPVRKIIDKKLDTATSPLRVA